MPSQKQLILSHLTVNGPITPLEALMLYGCFRLGARVYDLRQEGHKINRIMVKKNGKRVAQYFLTELKEG